MAKQPVIGSRSQVMHGTASKTSGGLTKDNLKYNKWGKIVSSKKSATAAASFHEIAEKFKEHQKKPGSH